MFLLLSLVVCLLCASSTAVSAADYSTLTAGNPKNFGSDGIIVERNNSTSPKSYGWVEYKQCDSRWANQELGYCAGLTICSSGCAMSSVAMILATKGIFIVIFLLG